MFRTAALTILALTLSGATAYAADANSADPALSETSIRATVGTTDWTQPSAQFTSLITSTAAPGPFGGVDWSSRPSLAVTGSRPRILPALYVSLAALQAFDVYSTTRGLSRGATESNPFMQPITSSNAGFIAMKAATTAVPMILAERMWKHNKKGAIAVMIIANGVAAAVGVNNAQVLSQAR